MYSTSKNILMNAICVSQGYMVSNTNIMHDEVLLRIIQLDFMQCFRLIKS
jgi:hypothetical protein